jgi:hypothetical protein
MTLLKKEQEQLFLKKKDNQPTKDIIEFYELNPK